MHFLSFSHLKVESLWQGLGMTSPKAGRGGRRSGSARLAATQSLREVKLKKCPSSALCASNLHNKAVWLSLCSDNGS